MASKSKKSSAGSGTRWSFYVLLLAVGVYVWMDVCKSGGWQKSNTYLTLNRTGVCCYTNKALEKAREGTVWVHNRIEEKFPGFTETTIELTTPYIELGRDLGLIIKNIAVKTQSGINAKLPYIYEQIDLYTPDFVKNLGESCKTAWIALSAQLVQYKEYAQKEVFVGKLAPEEIQKSVVQCYENAIEKAHECYHWLYEKVQSTIK